MQFQVGAVVEGKVTGITKFGAFVSLENGTSGLVHISEVANTYVNDVHDYVQVGQTVRVRIMSCGDDGKINLSIKKALEQPPRPASAPQQRTGFRSPPPARQQVVAGPTGDASFEDKLKHFMQESDSKIADNKYYADRRQSRGRRK